MRNFWLGFSAWWTGWAFILKTRRLRVLTALPFLLSLTSAGLAFWMLSIYYPILTNALILNYLGANVDPWIALLIKPLMWIGGLVITVLILYLVYVLHAIVAQPFYSLLAEQTLRLRGWPPVKGVTLAATLRASTLKALIFFAVGIGLFLSTFIPGLNLLAMAGTLALVAFDCMDYALETRGLKLRARWAYAFRQPGQWIGLATGLALTLFLPGLTLLVIPGAVVGAALMIRDPLPERIK